ncbi:uncharacterized protein JCM6883_007422 [Sporobolomyces salmoneus]|uniref:uncharacterized protein n=1 Tax=Sporobolomyces salmoneus TaxID=183962 RepID=UPI0031768503
MSLAQSGDSPSQQPPPTNARAGSPTATRKARGLPFPPPLSFSRPETTSDILSTGSTNLTSSSYPSSKSRGSPLTPDRSFQRSPRSPMDSGTRSTPHWNQGQGRSVSDGREHGLEGGAEQGRGQRGGKLSQSTSSGRPRNAQSVLGYSSMMKKGLSPGRGTRNEGVPVAGGGGVAVSPAATQPVNGSSRYLLTVIPPSHLPHDPPHPRTNPQCSGYGPPEHFKRGTLVPLYPTLSSQLAAIAREYGLPSTGGLVLYLLSTWDPSSSVPQPLPGSAGFAGEGGPRISEAAWSLLWSRLFEEEQEVYLVAEDELSEEEDFAPPVPPIPRSHQEPLDDDAHSREPSDEQAIFSGDEDNERTSFSSDAGVDHDDASSPYDKTKSRRSSASASRQANIGRGPPPSLPSPGPASSSRPSHRFSHSQQRYVSLPTSANSSHNLRLSSRNSLRSARSGLPAYYYPSPAASRSVSHGSYAPSLLSTAPTPGYGASVIVGKVEFDIDRSRAQGGKGKWYDAWIEGAVSSESSEQPTGAGSTTTGGERWQELRLPNLVKSKGIISPPLETTSTEAEAFGFSDSFTSPPPSHQPEDISSIENDNDLDGRARTLSGTSRGMESATSAWSLAAMAERVEQTEAKATQPSGEEEEVVEEDSIVDKEPIAAQESRPLSNASTALAESEKDGEGIEDHGYSQLEDEEESRHLNPASFSDSGDESSEYGGGGGEEELRSEAENDREPEHSQPGKDPLGDIFESDEATWRSLAADSSNPRQSENDSIETTGLGIVGARINELATTAPEGVVERLPEEQASNERDELPPPENDIGEVFSMLQSAQTAATASGPLASPIRLDDPSSTPSHLTTFTQSRETEGGENNLGDSPFRMSHSTNTSVSTVNFNVRPPSTIASMSPEYVPQRKQRQGWSNVPAVVEASISPSSSMGSIAIPDSQRASTIGLMENLDDLERALAELSPRANKLKSSPTSKHPEAIPEEEASPSFSTFAPPPRSSSREPQVESEVAAQEQPVEFGSRHLSPSVAEERPGLTATSSFASEESFVTAVPPTEASPVVESVRIPRSSSLSKAQSEDQQPHLVALPPSPLPPSPSSMNSNEAADDHTPTVDSANAEWSTLPPSPPRLPISLPEAELPPVPPKVEDVAPFASTSPATRSPGIKSLRMNKPWGNREGRTVKTQAAPEPNSEDSPAPKSPLGSFFGKSTFGKAKGFFKKAESPSDGPSSVTSPSTSPNPPAPVALPEEVAPVPVRKESLEVPSASLSAEDRKSEPTDIKEELQDSETTELPAPVAPFSTATESSHSPDALSRPDSLFYNEATPDYPPGTSAGVPGTNSPVVSPGSTLSPTSTSFPQPPPIRPFANSPSRQDFHLSSPRSDYAPQTPRSGIASASPSSNYDANNTTSYPASAPVTPAEWPNTRFGTGSTPGSERGRRKPRLSADIDQLLSQMNDIDFGIGGDDDEDDDDDEPLKKGEPAVSTINEDSEVVSPRLVEPFDPLENDEASVGSSSALDQEQQPLKGGMLEVQGNNPHRGILSADLSHLGSMMTGFSSPPLSPEAQSSNLFPNVA